jgi:hypothetical protein
MLAVTEICFSILITLYSVQFFSAFIIEFEIMGLGLLHMRGKWTHGFQEFFCGMVIDFAQILISGEFYY